MIYLKYIFIVIILIYISFTWNDLYNRKYYEHQTTITSTLHPIMKPTTTITSAPSSGKTTFNISWNQKDDIPLYKLIIKNGYTLEKMTKGTVVSAKTIKFFYFENTLYNKTYICLLYNDKGKILEIVKTDPDYYLDYTTTIDLDKIPSTKSEKIPRSLTSLPTTIRYIKKTQFENEYYELTLSGTKYKIYDIYERTPIVKSLYNYSDTFHFMKSEPNHQYMCDVLQGEEYEDKDLIINIDPAKYNNMLQMYAKEVES